MLDQQQQLEQCHTEFRDMAAELGRLKSDLAYERKETGRLRIELDLSRADLTLAEETLLALGYKKFGYGWAVTA